MLKRSRILTVFAVGSLGVCGGFLAALSACGAANVASYTTSDGGPAFGPDTGFPGAADGSLDASSFVPPEDGASGGDTGLAVMPPGPTSILAVHASANLFDFRLCFGVGGSILPVPAYPDDPSHPMPETNYPGVPVGGAALLPPVLINANLVTVYVIPAYYLESQGFVAGANEPTCDVLITNDLIKQSVVYFTLPNVTLPSLGGTVVLAIEGCGVETALAAGSVAQCGASFPGQGPQGNLSVLVGAIDAEDAGAWAVQLANLSPSFDPEGGTAALTYVDPTIDASISLVASASSVSATPVTLPLSEAGVTAAYFVIGPASAAPLVESLASIQYFQAPSSDPFTYFSAPTTYFVALVGDATDAAAPASLPDGAPNPAFDGHGLHVIAYPTGTED